MYTKKRDCNVAVPLTEALVLPSIPNNNTEAHAVCIDDFYTQYARTIIIHTHEHLVSQCFGMLNLPDSS